MLVAERMRASCWCEGALSAGGSLGGAFPDDAAFSADFGEGERFGRLLGSLVGGAGGNLKSKGGG